MILRYLTGGSIWDIHSNFEVSFTELYQSNWRVVDAINLTFEIVHRLQQMEVVFAMKSSSNAICGAVGSQDGCLLWQKNSGVTLKSYNMYFCSRREKFHILFLVI